MRQLPSRSDIVWVGVLILDEEQRYTNCTFAVVCKATPRIVRIDDDDDSHDRKLSKPGAQRTQPEEVHQLRQLLARIAFFCSSAPTRKRDKHNEDDKFVVDTVGGAAAGIATAVFTYGVLAWRTQHL